MCIQNIVILYLIMMQGELCDGVMWDRVRCAVDSEPATDGTVDMGRFPWLGVVQYSFDIGGVTRFAVTASVLIHPAYAIASAEDVSKIPREGIENSTKFIAWINNKEKATMDVTDYFLHAEFPNVTSVSLAILELKTGGATADGSDPVLPVCLQYSGPASFEGLHAVKIDDVQGQIQKEVYKMIYMEPTACEDFYNKAELSFPRLSPTSPVCAVAEELHTPCVWDAGLALVSRNNWAFWKLLGFGVRGPGCSAPAKFINIPDYMNWIDMIIDDEPRDEYQNILAVRRMTPMAYQMYPVEISHPRHIGRCDRDLRGDVLYKDSTEISMDSNIGQGFFLVEIHNAADVRCVTVNMDVEARTNTATWVEHHCFKDDITWMPRRDVSQAECFVYFKSTAYVRFDYFFSFKAKYDVTLYGQNEHPARKMSPFRTEEVTTTWYPTNRCFRPGYFVPYYVWWNNW